MTGNNRSPASVEDGCIKTALKMWYQTMMDFRVLFFCIEKKNCVNNWLFVTIFDLSLMHTATRHTTMCIH